MNKLVNINALEAKVSVELAKARATWPKFKVLEGVILQLLQGNPNMTLHTAYKIAFMKNIGPNTGTLPTQNSAQPQTKSVAGDESLIALINSSYLSKSQEAFLNSKGPSYIAYDSTKNINIPMTWSQIPEKKISHKKGSSIISSLDIKNKYESLLSPIPTIWTRGGAIRTVAKIQQDIRDWGYHVALGGSVLNKGESAKDLDLYFLPMGAGWEKPLDPKGLIKYLSGHWNKPEIIGDGLEYGSEALPYVAKLKFTFLDSSDGITKRVDAFLLGSEVLEDLKDILGNMPPGQVIFDIQESNVVHLEKEKW